MHPNVSKKSCDALLLNYLFTYLALVLPTDLCLGTGQYCLLAVPYVHFY